MTAAPPEGSTSVERASTPQLASVNLPRGGGAIRGIGEKFDVATATGTGSMTVPIALPADRAGNAPLLSLAYDSGSGNSQFGLGWQLDVPAITRKTDTGLPRYVDSADSDVYLLAGAEDLVPVLDAEDERLFSDRVLHGSTYRVSFYRPRTEGTYARIERWTAADGTSHWRVIGRDGAISLFGEDAASRVSDPADQTWIFSWLLTRSVDTRGNLVVYDYQPDDDRGVDTGSAHERHRLGAARRTQRYLKRMRYAFDAPWWPDWSADGEQAPDPTAWHFELVVDYGDHDEQLPLPEPDRPWSVRADPFSSYRSGFEVRTYRRCHRLLLFHHFPGEPGVGRDCLVRSTDLRYADQQAAANSRGAGYSYLVSVTSTGYRREGDGYRRASMPPLELSYSEVSVGHEVRVLDPASAAGMPGGLAAPGYHLADLDGEGLSGVLAVADGAWYYLRNLGPDEATGAARFGPPSALPEAPTGGGAGTAALQLLDLAGDGRLDAVSLAPSAPGFFERTDSGGWEGLRAFRSLPQLDWSDPNVTFVDLTGNGLSDVLVTQQDLFELYPSLGEEGFSEPEVVAVGDDEDRGPALLLADQQRSVFLADMTGDGMQDLVRVRDGEVCYWPSLGYGRFGAKVVMDDAPSFGPGEDFDGRRIRLADIDGTGTADLVHVGTSGVRVWFNRSGNGWAQPDLIGVFPSADDAASVQVVDLLGTGTGCLVWSSTLPADAAAPVRYVELLPGGKPHLLVRTRNNLGAETRISYAPSTRFFLEDQRAGRPWVTRLPFPVHVVVRVESLDLVGRSRFVTRYAYHHGYYDGTEREFRGFAMVEQFDTEEHRDDVAFPDGPATNWDAASWRPPVCTRTWFHTGAPGETRVSRHLAGEYWTPAALRGPANAAARKALELPDSTVPSGLSDAEYLEAFRSLRGTTLRAEVFALDGSARADTPYAVTEQCVEVRLLQPRSAHGHAVFAVAPRESVTFHFERDDADPRITHELTLEVNEFGDVLRSVSVSYPRRAGHDDPEPLLDAAFRAALAHDQHRPHVAATWHRFTEPLSSPDVHRPPLPAGSTVAELTGLPLTAATAAAVALLRFDEVSQAWDAAWAAGHEVGYEDVPAADVDGAGPDAAAPTRRVVEEVVVRYRSDDLSGLLPERTVEPLALPGESYRLALTDGLLTRVLDDLVDDAALTEGGYVQLQGRSGWWVPSGRVHYWDGDADDAAAELAEARAHFFLPRRAVDPFGGVSHVVFDAHDLLPVRTSDQAGNTTRSRPDYRVLQAAQVTDANGAVSTVAFDVLGLLVGTAVMGTAAESTGDTLDGFTADVDEPTMLDYLTNLADPRSLLQRATSRIVYDPMAFLRTREDTQPQAVVAGVISRETHVADDPHDTTRLHQAFTYADGFGREVQRKVQAEPGPLAPGGAAVSPRWVGSGWTIFDNKGAPVQVFEPFFTATHRFEFDRRAGVASVTFRDPLGRVIAGLHPDGAWEKTVFDAWRQETWDVVDTALVADPRTDPDVGAALRRHLGDAPGAFVSWHDRRAGGTHGDGAQQRADEKDAADKTAALAATPLVIHLDAVGRSCLTVSDAGAEGRLPSRVALDAESKPLAVVDALGRRVIEYCVREPDPAGGIRYAAGYDVAGNPLYRNGMDGGERRALADVTGRPLRGWDARGHAFRWRYDALRRMTHLYAATKGGVEALVERRVYGEGLAQGNLAGRLFRVYDGAGLAEHTRYDVNGNLVESLRQLAAGYRGTLDWSTLANLTDPAALDAAAAPLLRAAERYVATTSYNALDRPVQVVTPHAAGLRPNVIRPGYGAAGMLRQVDVWVRPAAPPAELLDPATATLHAVTGIEYNAKGQRTRLARGNGTVTSYTYDPETFRLRSLTTTRAPFPTDEQVVQALAYTYDPAGNVTRIHDDADLQNVVFFRNQRVEPSADYTYDALYRLVSAKGREHVGQTGGALNPATMPADGDAPRTHLDHPGDGKAMATYTETYQYDAVGNLLAMVHHVSSGGWARRYRYAEASLVDAAQTSNRLTATSLPGDPDDTWSAAYTHDEHGNMTAMPHLVSLVWDERDRLASTVRQVLNGPGTPETTHYVYDADGVRIRKVTDGRADAGVEPVARAERIYLGQVEVYRELAADGTVTLQRETLHVAAGPDRVALVETRTLGADDGAAQLTRYQYGNHLESALLELDDVADVISYEEYFPFGSTAYQAVRAQTQTPKRYRYSGKERDEETGLYYHGARYYAPWLGRWTACDPAGLVDGDHLYAYAMNNPVRHTDDTGTQAKPKVKQREKAKPAPKPAPKKQAKEPTTRQKAKKGPEHAKEGGVPPTGATVRIDISDSSTLGFKGFDETSRDALRKAVAHELDFLADKGFKIEVNVGKGISGAGGPDQIEVHLVEQGISEEQIKRILDRSGVSASDKTVRELAGHLTEQHGARVGERGKTGAIFVPVGPIFVDYAGMANIGGTEEEIKEAHEVMGTALSRLVLHEIGHELSLEHTTKKGRQVISDPPHIMDFTTAYKSTATKEELEAIRFTPKEKKQLAQALERRLKAGAK